MIIKVNNHDTSFISDHELLVDMSDEITNWEASSRYGSDIVSAKKDIDIAIGLSEQLLEEIKEKNRDKFYQDDNLDIDAEDNSYDPDGCER